MPSRRVAAVALAAALAVADGPLAAAQDSSVVGAAHHLTPAQAARFSKAIEQNLADRGARVAIVFRSGRRRASMPEGLAYTHGAFWVYRAVRTADRRTLNGYAVYNLYAGDGKAWPATVSRLVQDWPIDFTAGSVEADVAVIVPSPEMQRRLEASIGGPTYVALHNPSYTLIANPALGLNQNCNTFMLDVLAAAAWQVRDPAQVQADVRAWFKPSVVKADFLTRTFGPMLDHRLTVDDQDGPIATASYESIAAFMRENGLLSAAYVLPRPPDPPSQAAVADRDPTTLGAR